MDRLRPFVPEDVPAVVALRGRAFRSSLQPSPSAAERYFHETFFDDSPWRDARLPSWVYEDAAGRPAGFVGVLARRMVFRGEPLVTAVATQLMVDPAARGLAGISLLRRVLAGPQDLTLSDAANDAARAIWQELGGATSWVHSLYWTRCVRPGRALLGLLLGRGMGTVPPARLPPPPGPDLEAGPLDVGTIVAHLPAVAGREALRPAEDAGVLTRVLAQLEARDGVAPERVVVRERAGDRVVGWYMYFAKRGGVGEVVQLAAIRGRRADVLAHLLHHARRRRVVALAGRLEPAFAAELAAAGAGFSRDGPWTLVHARRPEVLAAVHRGDAFLSRLEGEWWLRF